MKYFDEKMTTSQMRRRYFELMVETNLSEEERAEVEEEHKMMCDITVKRDMEMMKLGYMTED